MLRALQKSTKQTSLILEVTSQSENKYTAFCLFVRLKMYHRPAVFKWRSIQQEKKNEILLQSGLNFGNHINTVLNCEMGQMYFFMGLFI